MSGNSRKIPFGWSSICCDDTRVVWEIAGVTDTAWRGKCVLQFADYPDMGSKPQTDVSGTENGNGIKYPTQWYSISTNADGNQIMRLAIEANRSTGSGFCAARVSGVLELRKT